VSASTAAAPAVYSPVEIAAGNALAVLTAEPSWLPGDSTIDGRVGGNTSRGGVDDRQGVDVDGCSHIRASHHASALQAGLPVQHDGGGRCCGDPDHRATRKRWTSTCGRDRHVLLGRAPHDPRRRSARVSGTVRMADRKGDSGVVGRHQDTGLPGWTAASRSQQTRLCRSLSAGYRSFLLAALDERIKAAVDVGWMTSFRSQIRAHVTSTVGRFTSAGCTGIWTCLIWRRSLPRVRCSSSTDRRIGCSCSTGYDSNKRSTISPARRSPCLFVCLLPP
jgi:hypothetical protein